MPFIRSLLLACGVVLGLSGMSAAQTPEQARQAEPVRAAYLSGDFAAALALGTPLAEAGNPVAQNILGVMYEHGQGVEIDASAAMDWYAAAADQDFAKAFHNLALLHETGMPGLEPDLSLARARYQEAVALGNPGSATNLGYLLETGQGGAVDAAGAADLYEQDVALGHALAMSNLGHLYLDGRGVTASEARARELFAEAGLRGNLLGMNNYARMLETGMGGAKDVPAALMIYRAAMAQGHAIAAYNIAMLVEGAPGIGGLEAVDALAHCLWAAEQAAPGDAGWIGKDCEGLRAGLDPDAQAEAEALAATL